MMIKRLTQRIVVPRPIKLARTIIKLTSNVVQKRDRRYIAKNLVRDIQDLGPLYVKAGQFVSSRKDVFGDEVSEEFSVLRDNITPLDKDSVKSILKDSNLLHVFDAVDYKPLASASIGQVHTAILSSTKKKVIIKVKRPNVKTDLESQLKVLNAVVAIMESMNVQNTSETKKLLNDFKNVILDEIDFTKEKSNLEAFHKLYQNKARVAVPKVYTNLCTDDVIVMEYIESTDIASFKGNRKQLARDVMGVFIDQLLYHGIMHGDPHPGNIRIAKDDRLVMYDFGNVLFLSSQERHQLKELVCQLVIGNTNGVISTMKKIGIQVDDDKATREYISKYMEYMRTIDINTFKTSSMEGNVKLPMRINNTIVRIIRIFGMIEGTCKDLDKNFNYFDLLENYVDSIFIDDDFLLYKITSDLDLLFNNAVIITNNNLNEDMSIKGAESTQQQESETTPLNFMQLIIAFNTILFVMITSH